MKRFIKKGKKTAGHGAQLIELGYEVEEADGNFIVEATEVVEDEQDFSTEKSGRAIIAEMVAGKKVFSYTTPFNFGGGKVLTSILACTQLGPASCLITKGPKKAKAPAVNWLA
jgi:hypothetical protein